MKRAPQIATLALAITACAGPAVGGQSSARPTERAVQPNIYEIAPEQVATGQSEPFIEVSGSATVDVPTDRAEVSFAMETRAEAADAAAMANAEAMERVLAAIRAGRFPDSELETFGYSLQPQYATDDSRVRRIVGYVAYNHVRATVGDVDEVGRLIDVAIAAGANRVAGIAFSASDTAPARSEALSQAVRSARAEAQVIAESLGRRLGSPLEIRGGAQLPTPRAYAMGAARDVQALASTPIEAGEQTVTANVTIRFALGPELSGR